MNKIIIAALLSVLVTATHTANAVPEEYKLEAYISGEKELKKILGDITKYKTACLKEFGMTEDEMKEEIKKDKLVKKALFSCVFTKMTVAYIKGGVPVKVAYHILAQAMSSLDIVAPSVDSARQAGIPTIKEIKDQCYANSKELGMNSPAIILSCIKSETYARDELLAM